MRTHKAKLIFDIDGTLTQTKTAEEQCFHVAFEKTFGFSIAHVDWSDLKHVTDWGITTELVQRHRGALPSSSELNQMIDVFLEELHSAHNKNPDQFKPVSGAPEFIERLLNMGQYKIGIATGSWHRSAIFKLTHAHIPYKNIPIGHSNLFISREDIMRYVIESCLPTESLPAIYFGDGIWDLQACQNMGIPMIGIDVDQTGLLKDHGLATIFTDFCDPSAILETVHSFCQD